MGAMMRLSAAWSPRQIAPIGLNLFSRPLSEPTGIFRTVLTEFHESLSKPFSQSTLFVDEIPKSIQHIFEQLAQQGWFIDPELPLLASNNYSPETTTYLCDFYRANIDEIEKRLVNSYRRRAQILEQAFEAHREGKYALSIPAFLIQADGIFHDFSPATNLFTTRQRIKAYKDFTSQIPDSDKFTTATLSPISMQLPLWMSIKERTDSAAENKSFSNLNRHQIIHGESTGYDTEENSLKAISLLSYLHWIQHDILHNS